MGTSTSTQSNTTPPTTTSSSTLSVSLVNSVGTSINSISSDSPGTAKALLSDASGAAIPNTVVTFTTDSSLATMSPAGGTALTDASGIAYVTLTPADISIAGATIISATAQVSNGTVSSSLGYAIGTSTITLTTPTLDSGSTAAAPLSAFGTAGVGVIVCSGSGAGTLGCSTGSPVSSPQVVTFSSSCASSGKAALSSSATTVSGVATASYQDKGCAGSDVITASASNLAPSKSVTIYVAAPTAGSIQYVSSTPTTISLAGTGGKSDSAVTFMVVDGTGNPISGKKVVFDLNTELGGITLTPAITTPATPVTSNEFGYVSVSVNAGTVSTPVRVNAMTCTNNFVSPMTNPPTCIAGDTLLSTQSSELTITTGIPSQSSFSLGATILNIEGWGYDGESTVLTARLADHFGNPVPDDTVVNFWTEGGVVTSPCRTLAGSCSATFSSQNIRPDDGRVTVLAYTLGEESFLDYNGNGYADVGEMFDPNGTTSTDKPEAWLDFNEDGIRDAAIPIEPFLDFNGDGIYNAADGKFNGVLCNQTAASPICPTSTTKTIHARKSIVIVLSGSDPVVTTDLDGTWLNYIGGELDLDKNSSGTSITSSGSGCGTSQEIMVKIVDLHGNLMPAGTTVAFAVSGNGYLVSPTESATVQNANTPIASITPYSVQIRGDGALVSDGASPPTYSCQDTTKSGTLSVTVTTPNGTKTPQTIVNLKN